MYARSVVQDAAWVSWELDDGGGAKIDIGTGDGRIEMVEVTAATLRRMVAAFTAAAERVEDRERRREAQLAGRRRRDQAAAERAKGVASKKRGV